MPYLQAISKDIFQANLFFFKKTKNNNAWGASLRYFSTGDIILAQEATANQVFILGEFRPTQWCADLSYNLKLSPQFALGTTARFLHSNLTSISQNQEITHNIAFDISGFYTSKEHLFLGMIGKYHWGFQIANISGKVGYAPEGKNFLLPTNLRLGFAYFLMLEQEQRISFSADLHKLLVPYASDSGAGIQAILASFTDAPNGFKEEFQEISWSLATQYDFSEAFCLRSGVHYQHPYKGDKQYLAVGCGLAFAPCKLDFAYIFPLKTHNPLVNSLQIAIQFVF